MKSGSLSPNQKIAQMCLKKTEKIPFVPLSQQSRSNLQSETQKKQHLKEAHETAVSHSPPCRYPATNGVNHYNFNSFQSGDYDPRLITQSTLRGNKQSQSKNIGSPLTSTSCKVKDSQLNNNKTWQNLLISLQQNANKAVNPALLSTHSGQTILSSPPPNTLQKEQKDSLSDSNIAPQVDKRKTPHLSSLTKDQRKQDKQDMIVSFSTSLCSSQDIHQKSKLEYVSKQEKYTHTFKSCKNHPSKKGKYSIEGGVENVSFCSGCAIEMMGKGVRVFESESSEKREAIDRLLNNVEIDVSELLQRSVVIVEEKQRQIKEICSSVGNKLNVFYDKCFQALQNAKREDLRVLEDCQLRAQEEINRQRNTICSHIIDADCMLKDIRQNYQQILSDIQITPFREIIAHYNDKIHYFLSDCKEFSSLKINPLNRDLSNQIIQAVSLLLQKDRNALFEEIDKLPDIATKITRSVNASNVHHDSPYKYNENTDLNPKGYSPNMKQNNINYHANLQSQAPRLMNEMYVSFENLEMFESAVKKSSEQCEDHNSYDKKGHHMMLQQRYQQESKLVESPQRKSIPFEVGESIQSEISHSSDLKRTHQKINVCSPSDASKMCSPPNTKSSQSSGNVLLLTNDTSISKQLSAKCKQNSTKNILKQLSLLPLFKNEENTEYQHGQVDVSFENSNDTFSLILNSSHEKIPQKMKLNQDNIDDSVGKKETTPLHSNKYIFLPKELECLKKSPSRFTSNNSNSDSHPTTNSKRPPAPSPQQKIFHKNNNKTLDSRSLLEQSKHHSSNKRSYDSRLNLSNVVIPSISQVSMISLNPGQIQRNTSNPHSNSKIQNHLNFSQQGNNSSRSFDINIESSKMLRGDLMHQRFLSATNPDFQITDKKQI